MDVILRAAARVFAKQGYAATTTNHIAARAGVSIGSLYEYFPNKDALLVALMEAHLVDAEVILERAAAEALTSGADVRDVVRTFVRAMTDLHSENPGLHRVLVEEAPLPPRVRRRIVDLERRAAAGLEAWLRANPGATTRDPTLAAVVVVQVIEGLTHRLVVHGEHSDDPEGHLGEMVALVTAYLAAP